MNQEISSLATGQNASVNASTDNSTSALSTIVFGNSEDIISEEEAEVMGFVLECVVFPIVTVFGVTGNIFSLVVLSQRKIYGASSTVVTLIGLTVADCLFLIFSFARESKCIIERIDPVFANMFAAKVFSPMFYLKTSMSRISAYLIVIISVERFLAVTFPLKVKSLASRKRMFTIVVLIYFWTLASLAVFVPQTSAREILGTYYIAPTQFYIENKQILRIYNSYVTFIIFRWIPKVLIIVFNTIIYINFRKRMTLLVQLQNSSEAGRKTKYEMKLTRMLWVVAVFFILCLLPGDAFIIANETIDEFSIFGKYRNSFFAFSDISALFEMINSSVNFIIYMLTNKTFFNVFKYILCRCFCRHSLKYGRTLNMSSRAQLSRYTSRSSVRSSISNSVTLTQLPSISSQLDSYQLGSASSNV